MMRKILKIIAIAATASAVAMPTFAAGPAKLSTTLTGAAEVPGPGDAKGKGSADLAFDAAKGEVCYHVMASSTDTPTAAHVHKGAAGVAGPPVVMLAAPANGMSQACVPVAADLSAAILAAPADYYVNVHTAAFPKGALRGQLSK